MKGIAWLWVGAVIAGATGTALAAEGQAVTAVENFGTARAAEVKTGLGFNIDPRNEWEFQIAQQIGASYVRFDCGWATTEKQNSDNTSGGFALNPACAKGLEYAKQYGLHPEIDALYGPPNRAAVMARLTADVPAGTYTLPLTVTKGSLGTLKPLTSQIVLERGKNLTAKHAYSGSLITGIDPAKDTVELAAATSIPLTAGTVIVINQILYPPILVKTPAGFLTDPSVAAYGRYARFLAEEIHQAGVTGEVGLWNEPDWAGDEWDNGGKLFDHPPTGLVHQPNIPLYMATTAPVEGVVFDNGYTEKTGNGSIYTPQHLALLPSLANARKTVAWESFHPYGNSPEDHFWYPECMRQMVSDSHGAGRVMKECGAAGSNLGSNAKMAVYDAMLPAAEGGPKFNITETGLCRSCNKATTEEEVARFALRQFIGFEGLGVSPIMFYRLAEKPKEGFGWIDWETRAPLPVFSAMKELMTDVGTISGAAVETCTRPAVTAYRGYYPLATVAFVGTRPGHDDKANSVLFFTWQRSYTVPREKPWVELASPAEVPVTIGFPKGVELVSVKNTVTGRRVPYHLNSSATEQTVTYMVADDPVEVWMLPRHAEKVERVACEAGR